MKRLLTALLLVVTLLVVPAWAKITPINITFEMEDVFVPFIRSYKLYMEEPGVSAKEHVATLDTLSSRDWILTNLDISPGKTVNFSLAAVYDDDVEDESVTFPWKSTGQPVILSIQRQK